MLLIIQREFGKELFLPQLIAAYSICCGSNLLNAENTCFPVSYLFPFLLKLQTLVLYRCCAAIRDGHDRLYYYYFFNYKFPCKLGVKK